MDTKEQIEQLKLAADLLSSNHPWEYERAKIWHGPCNGGFDSIADKLTMGYKIRPALIQPPEGLTLHNPDNLTGEQVGVGWRLISKEECDDKYHENSQFWYHYTWFKDDGNWMWNDHSTIRVPSSTPWPEIPKPWSLPPPPKGKQWMLADKWTQEMLPEGYRPLLEGEEIQDGDMGTLGWNGAGSKCEWVEEVVGLPLPLKYPVRTRRPLPSSKKKVPLGPEDVFPGSVLSLSKTHSHWRSVTEVCNDGLHAGSTDGYYSFEGLMKSEFEILRPGEVEWRPFWKEVDA